MRPAEKGIIHLLGKRYTVDILKVLEDGSKRFKSLEPACKGEKMRSQRLRELRSLDLVTVRAKRVEGRPVSLYSLSDKGKRVLRFAEDLRSLEVSEER